MEHWLKLETCIVIEQELEIVMQREWKKPQPNMALTEELRDAIYRIKQCKKIALKSDAEIFDS